MNFDRFMDKLAEKARGEAPLPGISSEMVIRSIHANKTGREQAEIRPSLLFFAVSGSAACISLWLSLDWLRVVADPLGMFIAVLGMLPLEIIS